MDQLDLFSSSSRPPAPEKELVKKAADPAMSDEKIEEEDSREMDTSFKALHAKQSFLIPKDEVIRVEEDQHAIEINTVQFEDINATEEEEVAADSVIPFVTEPILDEVLRSKPIINKDGKILQKRGRKSFKEMNAEVDLIEIPADEILYKKQYYAISEVAGWFKVNTSLLRFWETEFDVLKPRKNRKGDRLFRPEDVKNLQLIYHLLRDRKYTIDGAKDYLNGHKTKADAQFQITQTLQKFKSFLLELKANLQ
jgi:DNA-binding transcriptional MerR regulator